jgi:hypothetical protein
MKKIIKTLIPLFGASFSFIDPSLQKFTEKASILKELFVHTKVEKIFDLETNLENNQSEVLEKEQIALNKTKVFLIVNTQKGNNKGSEKNTLLLIGVKDQVNIYSKVKEVRENYYLDNKIYHTWTRSGENYKRKPKPNVHLKPMEKPDMNILPLLERMFYMLYNKFDSKFGFWDNAVIASELRGASYLTRQKGSYKSISPVFFEENSAKNFLIENLQYLKSTQREHEDILDFKENLIEEVKRKLKNKKAIPQELKNIENVKIVSLGLGDFINYYTTVSNQEVTEKVDFLFFPNLEKQVKTRNKKISMKGFKIYQQQLYGYNTLQDKKN